MSKSDRKPLPAKFAAESVQLDEQSRPGDERNPGSFFRRPGIPVPGKTYWSLAK